MSFYSGKKVIVTGAAGVLGQNIVRRLLDLGAYVYGTVFERRYIAIISDHLSILKVDHTDYKGTLDFFKSVNADIVINAAAVIKGAKGQQSGQMQLVRDNATMGVNIISAAVETKVKRFGFVGSSTMYPPLPFVTEEQGFLEDPWKGYLGVGNMKRFLEKVCMQFHAQSETHFAIARTTALYGPYDDFNLETCHVIPALVHKMCIRQDPLEVWGDGSEIRNFIYIEDFVDGLLRMIEHKADADPVNITNSERSTVRDIIEYGTHYLDYYTPEVSYDRSKPTMIPTRLVSTAKALLELNWSAQTPLRQGIEKTMQWYIQNYLADR